MNGGYWKMRHIKLLSARRYSPTVGQESDGKGKSISELSANDITFIVAVLQAVQGKKDRAAQEDEQA